MVDSCPPRRTLGREAGWLEGHRRPSPRRPSTASVRRNALLARRRQGSFRGFRTPGSRSPRPTWMRLRHCSPDLTWQWSKWWRGRAGRRDRGRRRTTRGPDDRHGQSWPGRRWSCHLRQRCRPCRSHRTGARPDPAHARRRCGSQRRRLSHRRSARRFGDRGRALPVASEVAKQLAAPVHVVRAVDAASALPMAPGVFGAAPAVDAEVTDQIWQEAGTKHGRR